MNMFECEVISKGEMKLIGQVADAKLQDLLNRHLSKSLRTDCTNRNDC